MNTFIIGLAVQRFTDKIGLLKSKVAAQKADGGGGMKCVF